MQIYYWSEGYFEPGITHVVIDGQNIKMYDRERSVCDAIRYRAKVGDEIAIEVVRNYINTENRNIDKLMKYANQLRINKIMGQIIKPLL